MKLKIAKNFPVKGWSVLGNGSETEIGDTISYSTSFL